MSATAPSAKASNNRIDWIDNARGLCVLLIVVLHVSLQMWQYGLPPGPVGTLMSFAETMRLPGLFLISGLLLGPVIDRPWRHYLDKKLVHFWYFFFLWCAIEYLLLGEWRDGPSGLRAVGAFFAHAFTDPGPLWFILMLPVFYVLAKLMNGASTPAILIGATAINLADPQSGVLFIDATAERFVFFAIGWLLAGRIGTLAQAAGRRPLIALAGIAAWAAVNAWATLKAPGYAEMSPVHLLLSLGGALVAVTVAALTARFALFGWLAYCGRNSIVVYLAHSLPIHFLLLAWDRAGLALPPLALVGGVTLLSIGASFALERITRPTPLRWLFKRPAWAGLGPSRRTSREVVSRSTSC
ncbi:acyltransferase family protein [Derxia gummosa]|uniref:Acyltransferase family protein n=1 Tax=Derxia gummosa DSM 723 TaxID=1121388 RepID=A0A8B6X565_9BURK|nr:acyltransferase family protein [Derxia gummosa]